MHIAPPVARGAVFPASDFPPAEISQTAPPATMAPPPMSSTSVTVRKVFAELFLSSKPESFGHWLSGQSFSRSFTLLRVMNPVTAPPTTIAPPMPISTYGPLPTGLRGGGGGGPEVAAAELTPAGGGFSVNDFSCFDPAGASSSQTSSFMPGARIASVWRPGRMPIAMEPPVTA